MMKNNNIFIKIEGIHSDNLLEKGKAVNSLIITVKILKLKSNLFLDQQKCKLYS